MFIQGWDDGYSSNVSKYTVCESYCRDYFNCTTTDVVGARGSVFWVLNAFCWKWHGNKNLISVSTTGNSTIDNRFTYAIGYVMGYQTYAEDAQKVNSTSSPSEILREYDFANTNLSKVNPITL
jgi:hypothetical protein